MFYTKNKQASGKVVKTVISEHNVFTHCPECCDEVFVDLSDLIGQEDFDIYGTGIYCTDCAKMILRNKRRKGGGGDFKYIPDSVRGCMTDEELEDALQSMNLSPAEEAAVREVCRKGFVIAPELMEKKGRRSYEP